MGRIKFNIHPLFLVVGIVSFFFGLGKLFIIYLITVILHELGHYYVAKKMGYELKNISLLPFGAELNINSSKFARFDEVWIAIAGPLVNLILIIICIALWWIFPALYFWTDTFVFANLVTLIFNVLPIYPLDGGRILHGLLYNKIGEKKSNKIINIISIILSSLFFVLFIVSIFYSINYSFGLVSIFLLTGAFNFNNNAYYERKLFRKDYNKLKKNGYDINLYAIGEDMPLYKLPPMIKNGYYNIFIILDKNGAVKKVIFEQNLENLLIHNDSNCAVKTLK